MATPKPWHELRVLAGPQAGASLELAPGISVDVGSLQAGGCQVVLRDPRVSEQRVRLHVRGDEVHVEVIAGSVDMAGQRFTAPSRFEWPNFLPVRIGDTLLAIGHPDDERGWARAADLADAPMTEPVAESPVTAAHPHAAHGELPHDASGESACAASSPAIARRRPETWLAIGGGVITAAACGLLAFIAAATPASTPVEPPAQQATRMLKATPEFAGLRAELDAEQHLHIHGDLLTLADRARLDRSLSEAALDASIEVRVGEQVAAGVRDVYRMNGIAAETAPPTVLAGVGVVGVKTRELDAGRLELVEAAARRDVPGLSLLKTENDPPSVTPPPTPVIDDPGKRVASIVPGATPYVVTADGTRYFIGALLPSGHRLASIDEGQVMLDKDGVLSPLKF